MPKSPQAQHQAEAINDLRQCSSGRHLSTTSYCLGCVEPTQQESTARYLQERAGRPHSLLGLPCLTAAVLQCLQGGVHAPYGLAGVQQGSQAPAGHARSLSIASQACSMCWSTASHLTSLQACGRAAMCLQRDATASEMLAGITAGLTATF